MFFQLVIVDSKDKLCFEFVCSDEITSIGFILDHFLAFKTKNEQDGRETSSRP
jgi:hypothetical protein